MLSLHTKLSSSLSTLPSYTLFTVTTTVLTQLFILLLLHHPVELSLRLLLLTSPRPYTLSPFLLSSKLLFVFSYYRRFVSPITGGVLFPGSALAPYQVVGSLASESFSSMTGSFLNPDTKLPPNFSGQTARGILTISPGNCVQLSTPFFQS